MNSDSFLSCRTIPGVIPRSRSRSPVFVPVRNSFSTLSDLSTGDNEHDDNVTDGNISLALDDNVLSVDSYQSVLNIPSLARLPKIYKVSIFVDYTKSSDYLDLPCVVNKSIVVSSIPDRSTISQYMDNDWANANGIQIQKKRYPERVEVVDGTEIASGVVTHEDFAQLRIDNHEEKLKFQLTKLGHNPIIIWQGWLK